MNPDPLFDYSHEPEPDVMRAAFYGVIFSLPFWGALAAVVWYLWRHK
jgi:hypothetical protein